MDTIEDKNMDTIEELKRDLNNKVLSAIEDAFDDFEQPEEINEEKSNTEFVTAQFADCKTLSDFQEKYNEIRNRSYNFM